MAQQCKGWMSTRAASGRDSAKEAAPKTKQSWRPCQPEGRHLCEPRASARGADQESFRAAPAAAQPRMMRVTEHQPTNCSNRAMARSYVLNYLHGVFATKRRRATIHDPAAVWAYIRGIARNCHFDLLSIGGTDNHVHLLLALPAGRNLSDVMRDIKASSSRFIRAKNRLFAWQDGYAGVSVQPLADSTGEDLYRSPAGAPSSAAI